MNSYLPKIVLLLALVCIILSIIKYSNFLLILSITFVFYLLFSQIYCSMYGSCYFSVYFNFVLALIFGSFLIVDYFGYLRKYKKKIKSLFMIYEENSNGTIKNTLFPKKSDLSNYYKKKVNPAVNDEDDDDDDTTKEELNEIKNNIYNDMNSIKLKCTKLLQRKN
jgi:hypothetical protein